MKQVSVFSKNVIYLFYMIYIGISNCFFLLLYSL
jgi:hypothetical protein